MTIQLSVVEPTGVPVKNHHLTPSHWQLSHMLFQKSRVTHILGVFTIRGFAAFVLRTDESFLTAFKIVSLRYLPTSDKLCFKSWFTSVSNQFRPTTDFKKYNRFSVHFFLSHLSLLYTNHCYIMDEIHAYYLVISL